MANRDDSGYKGLYRDDEVVVDKDGVPHYSGADPGLMKEYRRRVLFAYANLEGDGKDAQEEARDLAKKQQRFAKKLLDALHGEAWRCCQVLIEDIDKLREKDGYKHVFKCLQSIEKVTVIKKTEAFDTFFEKCHRRKGQSIDAFLRMQSQAWSDLQDITDGSTTMSEDLRTYFLLKHVGLSKDDRRQILLSNQSNYTMEGVEQALRVSYYDVHEREKSHSHRDWGNHQRGHQSYKKKHYAHAVTEEPNIPEEYENYETASEATVEDTFAVEDYEEEDPREVNSDAGASGDDEVFEAYAAMDRQRKSYKESRKHLRTLQKSRGFFHGDVKGEISIEDRKAAVQKEKQRTRCAACGKIGHWAGDQACAKTSSKIGPKKIDKKKGSGKGKSKGKAYLVGEAPSYFSLDFDEHDEDVTEFCNMVGEVKEELEEADPMLDVSVKVEIEIPASQIRTLLVPSFEDVRPGKLMEMKVYELSSECEAWGIATSGNKSELQNRLEAFFQGEPVPRKGCTKQFVQLRVDSLEAGTASSQKPITPGARPKATAKKSAAKPKATTSRGYSYATENDQPVHGESQEEFSPATQLSFSHSPERVSSPVAGTFRTTTSPKTPSPARSTEHPALDPRTGVLVPAGMAVGQIAPWLGCPLGGHPMVLRRNREDAGLFFGCYEYPRCRGTRKFAEVVSHMGSPISQAGVSRSP
ncbi:Retrovirus-related Pol polyprotein from transposon TNT 1-94 [Durusdinium trenchii]|uniref:Retrovirus-related Pol polyprotein from transposon TNT 1-94 n=1 Tax=Durusdinium trenchii TaxID=1381693 RepID=A0ABP0M6C8_9DINO